jgi:hypothetical protein
MSETRGVPKMDGGEDGAGWPPGDPHADLAAQRAWLIGARADAALLHERVSARLADQEGQERDPLWEAHDELLIESTRALIAYASSLIRRHEEVSALRTRPRGSRRSAGRCRIAGRGLVGRTAPKRARRDAPRDVAFAKMIAALAELKGTLDKLLEADPRTLGAGPGEDRET